jgi:hypothetical protein
MTTAEILEFCKQSDDRTVYKLHICGNAETLADGYVRNGDQDYAREVIGEALALIRDNRRIDYKIKSFFGDWHGGRFCQFYTTGKHGWVVCDNDAPEWVHDLASKCCDAMTDKAEELGKDEDNRDAEANDE